MTGPADAAAAVGGRIREFRRARGLSLSELARRAGLGKGTLSELEAGRRNPTLETLYALTAPLGIGLSALITATGTVHPEVHGDPVSALLLDVLTGPAGTVEVYRLTIAAGGERRSPAHGPGVAERLHVATGVALVGPVDSPVRVGPGQSHQWLSDREHLFQAEGPDPAVGVLLISHPPAEAAPPSAGRSGAGDENRTRVISLED